MDGADVNGVGHPYADGRGRHRDTVRVRGGQRRPYDDGEAVDVRGRRTHHRERVLALSADGSVVMPERKIGHLPLGQRGLKLLDGDVVGHDETPVTCQFGSTHSTQCNVRR